MQYSAVYFSPLKAGLNPICHLLASLGAHHILHISRVRVKLTKGIEMVSPLSSNLAEMYFRII